MAEHLRIGVVSSGGDAPGMNACLRSIVKGADDDVSIIGIRNGGLGLLRNAQGSTPDYFEMTSADVASTLNRSGTVLKTARESKFREFVLNSVDPTDELPTDMTRNDHFGQAIGRLAAKALEANGIDGLILIGGDTTCRAALHIFEATNHVLPIAVIPATIDNDIEGTVQTIGFDSAVSMAVLQVDALRETAAAMDRIFVVEVMGRDQGHIAVEVALATGAEAVLVPERQLPKNELHALAGSLLGRVHRSGSSVLVIVAEGARVDGYTTAGSSPAQQFAALLESLPDPVEVRVTILGHTLRGAPPSAFTRNLATRSGLRALDHVAQQARHPERIKGPVLLGMHHEGFLEKHMIGGSMVRDQRERVLAVVENEINRLAY